MAKRKRTTHYSVAGTKLYAIRDAKGRFVNIQTYKRAHSMDMKRKSKSEMAAGKKKCASVGGARGPGGGRREEKKR